MNRSSPPFDPNHQGGATPPVPNPYADQPPAYGAPARVHSPIKLGYKNTKYLTRIMFLPERNGGYWTNAGYEWFGGT